MRLNMFRLNTIFCIILFICTVSDPVFADIYIEEKITTTIAGKLFQGIKKIYIAKNKTLLDDPTISKKVIYDYDGSKVYLIDDIKKDVSIYALNNFTLPINEKIYSDFRSIKEEDILSKESGSKKKIGQYNCSEIVLYIPKIATLSRVWITKEIEAPLSSLFQFLEKNSNIMLKKIVPVLKNNNACVVESTTTIIRPKELERYLKTELKKVLEQDFPESLFNLPEDYRKLNMEPTPSPESK
jgi:hypothetical protein